MLRALLDATYAQPRLRRLYPVNSHYNLWFSKCTDFPFAPVGAVIQNDRGYLVRQRGEEGEYLDTPRAAATRATEFLPPDCGPAVLGTASDILE